MPRVSGFWLLSCVLLLAGCPRRGPDRPTALQVGPHRAVQLHDPELAGTSGLAVAAGDLLVVTERGHQFFRLQASSEGTYRIAQRKRVKGIAEGRDLEALAYLGPGRYAIGTETDRTRKKDQIHFLVETEDVLTSTRTVKLKVKKLFGVRAKDNQGVEGLCASGGYLVAAIETVKKTEDGMRLAPIAVLAPGASSFAPAWIRLLSETGKISSIHCRRTEGGLDVIAIERHYGVLKILRVLVPFAPSGEVLEATPFADLEDAYRSLGEPNFEGIERLDDGTLVLVSDNDHGGPSGPTVLLFVRPADRGAGVSP